ncbi:AmmeMemoRadiSam system radical SAM enzyme [Succinivibrio dextrinosolvens]|uniref:AmmeMemoRadiSam system radical SAM enzyme n=1 Tax=Succinivibrio dextrinosolvens TaxID=83771 RepID=UPI0024202E62|nr:AmmeMemoRadiSam system radical SAM enzyme [Succinivibrio dextrinosolvens]MBE6424006.1 AmmeMemoRadiSam system radical SAM enzyme [Succinivibrio dextrinosolvens]
MQKVECGLCPRHCSLKEGAVGVCKGRVNQNGVITALNYGCITSVAIDPIEKKPLYHFFPGSFILSVGSFGCNLKCPFCQNHSISMADKSCDYQKVTPEELVALALDLSQKDRGNLGIAFTYNEPLISYEFVLDTSKELKRHNLKSVLVTNGGICSDYFERLLPYVDAMNIDLKGFSQSFYDYVKGDFETVKENIKLAHSYCHVEVTTLIIPTKNDSAEDMAAEARFLSGISEEIPLHISRFFPRYKEQNLYPTPIDTIDKLCSIALRYLKFVHRGNC